MATIKGIKTQIENANALGRTNLSEQGVDVSADASTYDIMKAIANILGGSGVTYKTIVYNKDNTITLTDKEDTVHTMECGYTDGKLTSVKYNGKSVRLMYNGDKLVTVGRTNVDLGNVPSSSADSKGLVFFNMGDWILSGEPCNETPFEKATFYNLTIDGTVYRAGSNGTELCNDARDDVHCAIMYDEELGSLIYLCLPKGEEDFSGVHNIGFSKREEEEIGWRVTVNDWGYWYFYSNDFEEGKIDIRIIDEDGNEYWDTEDLSFDKIFDTSEYSAFGFKGEAHATDMPSTLEKAIASGKEITFIMKQTIDGVTTTKTYSGTYVAYYENPFSEDVGSFKYEYVLGNDYIPCAEGRSA
jgi:hypothetical protein